MIYELEVKNFKCYESLKLELKPLNVLMGLNGMGKSTIIQKMFGDYEIKFPQAKAFYTYVYAHPGKKLNFMGNEFAQFR